MRYHISGVNSAQQGAEKDDETIEQYCNAAGIDTLQFVEGLTKTMLFGHEEEQVKVKRKSAKQIWKEFQESRMRKKVYRKGGLSGWYIVHPDVLDKEQERKEMEEQKKRARERRSLEKSTSPPPLLPPIGSDEKSLNGSENTAHSSLVSRNLRKSSRSPSRPRKIILRMEEPDGNHHMHAPPPPHQQMGANRGSHYNQGLQTHQGGAWTSIEVLSPESADSHEEECVPYEWQDPRGSRKTEMVVAEYLAKKAAKAAAKHQQQVLAASRMPNSSFVGRECLVTNILRPKFALTLIHN